MINFTVNQERCIQCGKCVNDCVAMCIAMEKGEYPSLPDEGKCYRCQHCMAVCPTAALSVLGVNPDESMPLEYEMPAAHSMETLIKGRRSVRNYKKQGLPAETIQRLLNTAWHAPTGVNTQGVYFTATMNTDATEALRQEIYAKLGPMLADLDPEQDDLGLTYMRMSHRAYTNHGADIILRGAPHILVASAPATVPTPKEDTLIALTTFELMAQSMGVGTLWNGMLKWCLTEYFPELATRLGVPEDHMIGYTMVFGPPAVRYPRTVQRTAPKMNLVDSF